MGRVDNPYNRERFKYQKIRIGESLTIYDNDGALVSLRSTIYNYGKRNGKRFSVRKNKRDGSITIKRIHRKVPLPSEITATRQKAGLTVGECASMTRVPVFAWFNYEGGAVAIEPETWELFLMRLRQKEEKEKRKAEKSRGVSPGRPPKYEFDAVKPGESLDLGAVGLDVTKAIMALGRYKTRTGRKFRECVTENGHLVILRTK